jgi:hypothetical protein
VSLRLGVRLSRHDPQVDDGHALFSVNVVLGGDDREPRRFDDARSGGAVKGTELHRNTQPVLLDPTRIIAGAE